MCAPNRPWSCPSIHAHPSPARVPDQRGRGATRSPARRRGDRPGSSEGPRGRPATSLAWQRRRCARSSPGRPGRARAGRLQPGAVTGRRGGQHPEGLQVNSVTHHCCNTCFHAAPSSPFFFRPCHTRTRFSVLSPAKAPPLTTQHPTRLTTNTTLQQAPLPPSHRQNPSNPPSASPIKAKRKVIPFGLVTGSSN